MSDTLPLLLPEGDRMTGLTIGSLFSGMGGLDRAAEQVFGARTVWVSDIDKGACKVLAHRYPHAPNLGDITRVDWATVPRVGIITGGYPCQPFSQAGRRMGQEDERHLWPYVADALTRWGEYAAAIARHEQAWGVPAPEPTEEKPLPRPTLNWHGNPRANPGRRLSAKFTEWMMMQPAGWITDVPGVTRNEALKLCGNGVVTPQAVHALRVMLDRIGAA